MQQTFFIGCTLPSLNTMVADSKQRKGNWSQYAHTKQIYESMIKADIKNAKLKPIEGKVLVHCHWVERDRRRDPDNIRAGIKFIMDSLVNAQILKTDSQRQIQGFCDRFSINEESPGVFVTLEEVTT